MYSLRRRLMLMLAIGFFLLIALSGTFIVRRLNERATEEFDDALLARARSLIALTEQEDTGQIVLDFTPALMPEFAREDKPDYFQIWLAKGDTGLMLTRSERLTGDLPRRPGLDREPSVHEVELEDGRRGRMLQIAFVPRVDDEEEETGSVTVHPEVGAHVLVLCVARGRERLDTLLARIRTAMFLIGGAATLLAVGLVSWVLAVALRPVEQITAQVKELDADNLDAKISLEKTPIELAPIADQLNAMLGRLRDSFGRERRFTGNVAHELRTPIAELRSLADVGSKWPDDRESVVGFFGDVRDIAARMETMIADLLLLARCEAGVERLERSPVSLREFGETAWARLEPAATPRGITFDLGVPADLVIRSDGGKLSMMFANTLGNAVHYAKENTVIRMSAGKTGDQFELRIENAAEPLGDDALKRLAEPFWRKDESRSSADHAGLGLSVVNALATLLGLELGFEQDQDGTFRVRLAGKVAS